MIEALAIRILHVLHALRLKRTPGLCPPSCKHGHTYRWPCRGRFTKKSVVKKSFTRDAWTDRRKR